MHAKASKRDRVFDSLEYLVVVVVREHILLYSENTDRVFDSIEYFILYQSHIILLCSDNNIIKNLVLVSSYKTCFNINSNFIRIKYKYHYFNRNVRIISKRNINVSTT